MCVSVPPSCAEYVLLQFIFLPPELGKYNLVLIIKSPGPAPELRERKLLAYLGCTHKYKQTREAADLCIALRGETCLQRLHPQVGDGKTTTSAPEGLSEFEGNLFFPFFTFKA